MIAWPSPTTRLLIVALALAAPAPPWAQEARPFGGFRHDNSEPIEVTSDRLEVREAESIAIFSGGVIAGQGTLRLNADRVTVRFDRDAADRESGAIRNMLAEGNVFLSNGAETAEGNTGEYDVASGMMFLRGDVVLTQGQNVIAGETLEINLTTGVAKMVGERPGAGTAPQDRIRMRLVPASRETGSN